MILSKFEGDMKLDKKTLIVKQNSVLFGFNGAKHSPLPFPSAWPSADFGVPALVHGFDTSSLYF